MHIILKRNASLAFGAFLFCNNFDDSGPGRIWNSPGSILNTHNLEKECLYLAFGTCLFCNEFDNSGLERTWNSPYTILNTHNSPEKHLQTNRPLVHLDTAKSNGEDKSRKMTTVQILDGEQMTTVQILEIEQLGVCSF